MKLADQEESMTEHNAWTHGAVAVAALLAGLAAAQAGSLKVESWRNDDADIWNSTIIPAFKKHYPGIKIESAPKEYNAALNARLAGELQAILSPAGRSTPHSISIPSTRSTVSTT
jgi:ABC-type glycerol-3-phosphate transport system substrate-binding protein